MSTILITGAAGAVGGHLTAQLAAAGHRVRALTRDPAGADLPAGVEAFAGDLTRPATIAPALDGVEAMHLVTVDDDGADLATGGALVALAEAAGVRRFTVLSDWEETSVEAALRAAGAAWTALLPVELMGGALDWADAIRADGVLRQRANWPTAVVHEADVAAVAAVALTQDGHAGQRYRLTGPEALTAQERAALIGAAIGRPVGFETLTEDEERERLRALGCPEEYVEFGVQLAAVPPARAGVVRSVVAEVTGRRARTFARWAREHADAFRPAPVARRRCHDHRQIPAAVM